VRLVRGAERAAILLFASRRRKARGSRRCVSPLAQMVSYSLDRCKGAFDCIYE